MANRHVLACMGELPPRGYGIMYMSPAAQPSEWEARGEHYKEVFLKQIHDKIAEGKPIINIIYWLDQAFENGRRVALQGNLTE